MLRFSVLLVSVSCTVFVCGYKFDKTSCNNMLPKFGASVDANEKGKTSVSPAEDSNENESDHNTKHDIDTADDLLLSPDNSPYKIVVSSSKYRRNRPMTVRIEGGEFNGVFMQARNFKSGISLGSSLIGSFFELPPGVGTLDCDIGHNFSVANTAYTKNATGKKDLQLKWKAPSNDVGSIEFVATLIHGQHYWTSVKSQSLLFNEFPPSLEGCGKDRSCYRYSDVKQGCAEAGICDYVVVSQVIHDDVVFTIGGKIKSGTGYVGIGFTDDTEKLSFIDMCICMKTSSQKAEAAHYMVQKNGGTPEKQNVQMEDAETDVDGNNIWCRFRRPLQISGSQAADLTHNLFQLFLWGELDSNTQNPLLPKKEKIVSVMEKWNHTQTLNVIHYVGVASDVKSSWTILFVVLTTSFLELFLI